MTVSIDVQCAAIEKTNFICDNPVINAVGAVVELVPGPAGAAVTAFDIGCAVADFLSS
jgi:hypothetical protein